MKVGRVASNKEWVRGQNMEGLVYPTYSSDVIK